MEEKVSWQRVDKAAKAYMKHRGMDVIDQDDDHFYFCYDKEESNYVICKVELAGLDTDFDRSNEARMYFESKMVAFMSKHASDLSTDAEIRFDIIQFQIINNNRALVRHAVHFTFNA